jgi:hypothetical protein
MDGKKYLETGKRVPSENQPSSGARGRQIPSLPVLRSTQTAVNVGPRACPRDECVLNLTVSQSTNNNGENTIMKHPFRTAALSFGVAVMFGSAAVVFAQTSDTTTSSQTTTTLAPAPAIVSAPPVVVVPAPPAIVVAAPAVVQPQTTTTEHQSSSSSDSSPGANSSEHSSSTTTSNY